MCSTRHKNIETSTMSWAEKMKWKVEKWGDVISAHISRGRITLVYLVIILDIIYGHMYRQCWFTALHSEIEKHPKIEVYELWRTQWILCPAPLYSIIHIYNDTIHDINNKFGNNSYWDGVMCKTNVDKKIWNLANFIKKGIFHHNVWYIWGFCFYRYYSKDTTKCYYLCIITMIALYISVRWLQNKHWCFSVYDGYDE